MQMRLSLLQCNTDGYFTNSSEALRLFLSTNLPRKDSFKDLGVVIDEKLIFREHMHDKINKAYAMFGIIKRNFNYFTVSSFVLLYKCMVRSHLDYCS